jgi:hypothetical protein
MSVDTSSAGPPVPADFLGLSYEVKALPQVARWTGQGNFVSFLRSLGPGVIRFGGVTADTQMAWSRDGRKLPPWATGAVTPPDLASLEQLLGAAGWRALLAVNLAHFDPMAAADEVAAARAQLGEGLAGIELGNEPNAYAAHGLRSDPWTFDQYRADVGQYRAAIESESPGFPLAGPAPTSGKSAWLYAEAALVHPALLTAHLYSLNCQGPVPLDVPHLLSSRTRTDMARLVTRFKFVQQSSGIPLRIAETNNVSCGGRAGVSNSFGSALWATDLITQAMEARLAGVNFHGQPSNCRGYTPLCAPTSADLAAGQLTAQPEWYALLLARRLLGDRPLRVFLGNRREKVSATAFASPSGALHVAIVDERPHHDHPLQVNLRVSRRFRTGTILRLTARLPSSTAGVTLGGRAVAPDGTWSPASRLPRVSGRPGRLALTVPAGTAALVTVR